MGKRSCLDDDDDDDYCWLLLIEVRRLEKLLKGTDEEEKLTEEKKEKQRTPLPIFFGVGFCEKKKKKISTFDEYIEAGYFGKLAYLIYIYYKLEEYFISNMTRTHDI